MQYDNLVPAVFHDRPNRFIANIEIGGSLQAAHVKNTGRCREILMPGAGIWVRKNCDPHRKTRYDVIAAQKGGRIINIDASAPNTAVREWLPHSGLFRSISLIRPEIVFGSSRFDFYWEAEERRGFVEVKGVTLEEDGAVLFPDAPTERGVKHVEELIRARSEGCEAALCFILQRESVIGLKPNDRTHPAFGQALRRARAADVTLLAAVCRVTPDSCTVDHTVPVILD